MRAHRPLGPPLDPIRLDGSLPEWRRVDVSLRLAGALAPARGALLLVVPLERPRAGLKKSGIHHSEINRQNDEEREEQQVTHRGIFYQQKSAQNSAPGPGAVFSSLVTGRGYRYVTMDHFWSSP